MLFDHVHAYKRYEQITEAAEAGIEPTTSPAHDVLRFEDSNNVPESLRCTVAENGWWDANNEAFPTVMQIDPHLTVAQVHLRDVVFFETMTRALAKALEWLGMLLDLANQLLVPVTHLDARDLKQMLFDDIPGCVMLGSDSAPTLVASLKLAYQWMMTRHPLAHAADCLDLLNNSAIESLETRLVDAQLFGRRKTRTIADLAADFDTTTIEGFNTMMHTAFAGSSGCRQTEKEAQDKP